MTEEDEGGGGGRLGKGWGKIEVLLKRDKCSCGLTIRASVMRMLHEGKPTSSTPI
jgi:hypothetical protein